MSLKNKDYYKDYIEAFLKQNSYINLISKNDEKFLWEKHIYDSLSIEKFFKKYYKNTDGLKFLDIGTGGGFPSVPVALAYPKINVTALDSIRKKINAIAKIKDELKIKNLNPVCDRAENISEKYDVITARAVSSLDKVCEYALPLLKKSGYFVAYKSVKAEEEINKAASVLKKFKAKTVDIIEYQLPLTENYTRNLVIIKKD